MCPIPTYNKVQKLLYRAFFSSENAVTIYTEDKKSDKLLYEILLNRLVEGEVTINSIVPLGSKHVVIEESIRSRSTKNNSLFIIDCDIKILNEDFLETDNLISLRRYCIENYLCCDTGIIEYLYLKLGTELEEIIQELDFEKFIRKNFKQILNLYYRYFLSFELGCGCSFKNVHNFIDPAISKYDVDSKLVKDEIILVEKEIKSKLKSLGFKAYAKEMKSRLKMIKQNNPFSYDSIIKILSGKDQLLPLIRFRINRLDTSSRYLTDDQFKRLIAEKVALKELEFLKQKIISAARN